MSEGLSSTDCGKLEAEGVKDLQASVVWQDWTRGKAVVSEEVCNCREELRVNPLV